MANHVSAAKRARQRIKRTTRNRLLLGSLRSSLKRARTALGQGDAAAAAAVVGAAAKAAARAASKGIIHRNAAARLSSRLQRALNKLGAAPRA
jgi:small subunit ribosomal protein S20